MVEPLGVHHVTAVASDPQRNVDFYLSVLGLRLLKQTVNFDVPDTYHLYYGDEQGTPGTILTFFPWPNAPQGRRGTGQATATSFSVPPESLGWWRDHLRAAGVETSDVERRFEEEGLAFADPDGLFLELVAHEGGDDRPPWERGPIPTEHAIRGFHSVAFSESGFEASAELLTETLGFRLVAEGIERFRFAVGAGAPGQVVDVLAQPEAPRGLVAAGTVHHVAWRAPDDATQQAWREEIVHTGVDVTPVIDRQYFHSIYFREPGGVLLEIATDPPGFSIDEPLMELGRRLRLPPWLEPSRDDIQRNLPPLKVPDEQLARALAARQRGQHGQHRLSGRKRLADDDLLGFEHLWEPGTESEAPVLLLLHGTGGDERDLLPLGRALALDAPLLSPRGKVSEGGMPRWFRRLAEGVFDEADLVVRSHELVAFVDAAAERFGFARDRVVAVGFSNGANVAAAAMLLDAGAFRGAVLLSPMVPLRPETRPDLSGVAVFIGAGRDDPIAPPDQATALAELLSEAGASVDVSWHPGGHALTAEELEAARSWLARLRTTTGSRPTRRGESSPAG